MLTVGARRKNMVLYCFVFWGWIWRSTKQGFFQRGRGRSFHVERLKTEKAGNQQCKVWHKDLEGETTEGSTESTGGCINFESCRRHKIHSRFNMLPRHWLCAANSSIHQYETKLIVTEYTTKGVFWEEEEKKKETNWGFYFYFYIFLLLTKPCFDTPSSFKRNLVLVERRILIK